MRRDPTLELCLERFLAGNPAPPVRVSCQVRALLARIHDRELFEPGITVNRLKARCQIRDNNISLQFRREMGVSLKGYVEELRLQAAAALLECGLHGSADVAHAVGYDHLQTFYRAFQRRFGCTPGAFRGRPAPAPTLALAG